MLDSASFVLANSKKRPLAASQCLIALAKPNDDIFMVLALISQHGVLPVDLVLAPSQPCIQTR
jgi:hypothetical protein